MKKSLIWILLIILLIGVGFAANFAIHQFTGLGPIPTRSAFANRLPSIEEGDQRRFRFFYATNRENTTESFKERGNVLSDTISTGTFDTLISPYMLIEPFAWFVEDNVKWGGRQELPKETFRSQLNEAIQDSPQKSLLVIVWGFRDWFQSAALKTSYTAYALDINTPVLLFDWPGNQGEGRSGYRAAQEAAAQSALDLGGFLASALRDTGVENVWIMGSSLGCQVICDALKWLTTQPDLMQSSPKISHVVLSAPDVSADAFDDKFAESILKLSKHLTAFVSSNDRALLMSSWVNGARRLGRKAQILTPPEDRTGQYEFEEALELLDLKAKGVSNIAVVDATPINLTRNLHHFFTDSPEFFDDLYQRLLDPDHIVSRRLHHVRLGDHEDRNYWILWNY